eukprot:835315-Prorocentrum_minimum.AAC.4
MVFVLSASLSLARPVTFSCKTAAAQPKKAARARSLNKVNAQKNENELETDIVVDADCIANHDCNWPGATHAEAYDGVVEHMKHAMEDPPQEKEYPGAQGEPLDDCVLTRSCEWETQKELAKELYKEVRNKDNL